MANNFPNLLPSLNLDLVNGIYVDPRITFTRAGTRTFFGREMVKAEENLMQFSQEFDNAYWTKVNATVTANTTTAPDGTTTADTVTASAGTHAVYVFNSGNSAAGTVITGSVFAKKNTHDFFQVWIANGGTESFANFNLDTGVIGTSGSGVSNHTITSVGDGWYRCSFTFTNPNNGGGVSVALVGSASATRLQSFTAAGTESVFVWGIQKERRNFLTAYTATTTQPITRSQRLLKTAAANEWPREFDPVTGECLGRSVWESRTNLFQRSEEFDNAYWTKSNSTVTANQIIAPDGTLTGDLYTRNLSATSDSIYSATIAFTTGTSYSFSVFAKVGGKTQIKIEFETARFAGSPVAVFDLSTGTTISSVDCVSLITSVGNGWYRCSVSAACDSSGNGRIYAVANGVYTGDGYSGIYIWGAQLEAGAFATPYIPTVASQVTRLADSAVMTGVNFSSWFNPEQGCIYSDFTPAALQGSPFWVTSGESVFDNGLGSFSSAGSHLYVVANAVVQADVDAGTATVGVSNRISGSYAVNSFSACVNGGSVATDSVGMLPIVDRVNIGRWGPIFYNGYIKRLTYYPQALTAANLQAVTR